MYLLNNILTMKMYTSKPNPRRNSAYRPFSKPDMKVISTFFSSNKKKCDVVCILGSLLDFTSHLTAENIVAIQKNVNTKSRITPGMHSTSPGHDRNTV